MHWAVMLEPATLALYGEGVITTLWLLGSSLAVGASAAAMRSRNDMGFLL